MSQRRSVTRGSVAVGTIALLALSAACGSSDDAGGSGKDAKSLTWVSTGGAGQQAQADALQAPFTQKSGVKFNNVSPFSLGQLRTMVEAKKPTWDVVATTPAYAFQYCGVLFEKLDKSKFEMDTIPDGVAGDCVMPQAKYGIAFAYNTEMVKGPAPTRVADFFDPQKYPGKRVVFDQPNAILEMALMADGVDPDRLYPLDVDRAFTVLDKIKKDLIIAPSYTALQQNLVSKQASMTIALTGRESITADSGAKLAPVWDTTMWDFTGLSVVKGTPKAATAVEALVTAMGKGPSTDYAAKAGLTPVRTDVDPASVSLTPSQKLFNPFLPGNGKVVAIDHEYYAKNQDTLTQRWTSWKVGG